MKWSWQAGLPHYMLHALSRSILAGDCDLAVIAENEQFSRIGRIVGFAQSCGEI